MLGWFHAIMPKEDKFFELFARHATVVVAGADALRSLLRGGDQIPHFCREIVAREAEADAITRDVLTAVRRSFITPFDRTDIHDLISSMDDAIDQMNKTAKIIALYEVQEFTPQMQAIGELSWSAARLVNEAMPLLGSLKRGAPRLSQITEEIVQLEERADDLHDHGRKALFIASRESGRPDKAMDFIISAEIFDHLESVMDRFEDIANEVNDLVVDQL